MVVILRISKSDGCLNIFLKISFTLCGLTLYICHCRGGTYAEVLRPRGVSLAAKSFYDPVREFNCIDGSGSFPFYYVNDDYCDCADGSDEPGTAACPNGRFHCSNLGYLSKEIPSSRVNDGICDCCDGSDEYNSSMECFNLCVELGRKARAAAQKKQELYEKGYQLWQQYSSQGKEKKESNRMKLQSLKSEEDAAVKVKQEKEAVKNEAEEREKAALSKYETLKEEAKAAVDESEMLKHQEEERNLATQAFKELDLNQDGVLSFNEIQQFSKFDSNHDGIVSEDEGKFFLHMKESMELEEFTTTGWMIMKPIYMLDKIPLATVSPAEAEEAHQKTENGDYDSYDEDDMPDEMLSDDDIDEDDLERPAFPPNETPEPESHIQKPNEQPVYDEETQRLIEGANTARKEFREASDKLDTIQEEMKQLQSDIEADFGTEEQFGVLKGQCFDYDDREYTYRLCPFDRATQVSKSGGSDVSLGRWGHWAGPEDNKYSKMKYENGQGCWNGPARSTMVLLHCGVENRILSASEPNRCEYVFEFNTPAMCFNPLDQTRVHQHIEL